MDSTAKPITRPTSCFDCEYQSTACPGSCYFKDILKIKAKAIQGSLI